VSVATLIKPDDPSFAFEHDQFHRQMLRAIPSSAVTPILDPIIGANVPAGNWNTDHTRAHADFASAFPGIYWPSTAVLSDIDLGAEGTPFWAFTNRQLHDLALTAL
jgi:hypothetical protein